jgi:hypothetical protein
MVVETVCDGDKTEVMVIVMMVDIVMVMIMVAVSGEKDACALVKR